MTETPLQRSWQRLESRSWRWEATVLTTPPPLHHAAPSLQTQTFKSAVTRNQRPPSKTTSPIQGYRGPEPIADAREATYIQQYQLYEGHLNSETVILVSTHIVKKAKLPLGSIVLFCF